MDDLSVRRAIRIDGIGKELPLSKFAVAKVEKQFIHLDQLPDGTWRLVVSHKTIPDMRQVMALTIVRNGNPHG